MTDKASTPAPAGPDAPATDGVEGFFDRFAELEYGEDAPDTKEQDAESDEEDETEATDTDAAEADETPDDEAEEAKDDEATDEGDDEQPLIPVKIDGKVEKVSLEELKKGYSRTKVFTQKTQEAAEVRKAAETERAQAAAEREQLAKAIATLRERLDAADPEPDWEALKEDREEFLYQKAIWADKREEREKLDRVQAEMLRRNAEEQQRALASTMQAEQKALLEKVPAWSDPKKAEAELAEIRRAAAETYGFPDDMLDKVYDHRVVLLMRDAARYQRLMANKEALPDKPGKAKTLETGPKPLKPGAGKRAKPAVREAREAAMTNLRKSGRTDDAAAVFRLIPGFAD